ncbi:N-alpha-acetyltransferase 38, NatC auxiliary subunit-like isoform X1 [Montipora capricornis]|uniref:N-alpha-acetyltransferase 38, NatC auxiliary subunit-like isoform X1 n=1 Tax=Montipora foliosa TaxID=591990 RepID=UPI0035F133FD
MADADTALTDGNMDSIEKSEKRKLLESWLNKIMKIKISDGRTLIGSFLCTDQDRNIILGSCQEFVGSLEEKEEPRILGLAMVPGKHIVSIEIDLE